MFDFLKSLVKGRAGEAAPGLDKIDATEVALDLKSLERVDPELSKRAIDYVLTGEGGSVLLQLEQRQSAVSPVLNRNHYQNRDKEEYKARQRVLTREHGPEAAWLRRYGEVLAIQHLGSKYGIGAHQGPSPLWLRTLVQAANEGTGSGPLRFCAPFETMLGWRDPEQSAAVLALDILVLAAQGYNLRQRLGTAFFDFARHLPSEFDAVSAAFQQFDKPGQVVIVDLLKRLDLISGQYFDFVYGQYLSTTSKQVREAAQNALLGSPAQALADRAAATLAEGNTTARAMAAQLLPIVLKEQARPLLEAHLAKETAKSVRKVIELGLGASIVSATEPELQARTLSADGPAGYIAADGTEVLTPPLVSAPGPGPVSAKIRQAYGKLLDRAYDQAVKFYEHQKSGYEKATAERQAQWRKRGLPQPPTPVDPTAADRYCDVLAGTDPLTDHPIRKLDRIRVLAPWGEAAAATAPFNDPELTLWHLVRALALQDRGHISAGTSILAGTTAVGAGIRSRLANGVDLRSLASALPAPIEPKVLVTSLFNPGYWAGSIDIDDELVWPYLCANFDVIDEALGLVPAKTLGAANPRVALERLQVFPKLPARYLVTVLGHAIGPQKMLSAPARALLLKIEGVETRILPYLDDGKQDVRIGVATMLGALGAESAIEPLRKALAKEKSELARAAMLNALNRLKADIAGYVSPEILVKEAAAGLKGKKVKDLPWFPFEALPALEWAGGGAVPADVMRWWILLAAKLAQPGGNMLFSLWLDQLKPASAEALGRHLLASFLNHDSTPFPESEANAYAQANAQARFDRHQKMVEQWRKNPNMAAYADRYAGYTYEKAFAELRAEKMAIYPVNAYADRGILGLATRADGVQAVPLVRAYMRDHYTRTAQVRALVEYLSGNPSTATLQLLLSIARRHRTKQVQLLAGELVQRISDERGWTSDELADRTVPTAGLDERGVLDLPIGDRSYEAKLEADDTLTLYNPAGKPVQSLPQVKEGPDKESAAEAKTALSNAKKELKQVHEFQAKRLYESLCVGRQWPAADWQQYLLEHPIVGRLVQRLVWLGLDGAGKPVTSFRPLDDLSLSDVEDGEVSLESCPLVQLAHRSLLPAETTMAWQQHLVDYKIAPLFEQLDRPLLAGKEGTAIEDRHGFLLEAFKLRSVAQKLGYERGAAEDGGWFTEYRKPFTSIGIVAVIGFTGSPMPEENREVALTEAQFLRVSGKRRSGYGRYMPLAEVPPVLLSEIWNDFHQIAAAGPGFAEDWRKRVGW